MTLIEEWWELGERQVTGRKKTGYGGRLESLKMGPFIYSGKTKTQAVWERLLTNQIASLVLTYPLIGRALHVRVRTPHPEQIKILQPMTKSIYSILAARDGKGNWRLAN